MKKQKEIDKQDALTRLRQTCSKTEKSKYYVRTKLIEWGLGNSQEEIIDLLEEEHFLNEERFTFAFAQDKFKLQKWGKIKIRFHLMGMQVPENIVEKSLANIGDIEYEAMVQNELAKKIQLLKSTDVYQLRQKLFQFGNQRGYESDILNKILDTILTA